MKRRTVKIVIYVLVALVLLFAPVPIATFDDGGTMVWESLTYTMVRWKTYVDSDEPVYENTRIYWFNDKRTSISELWEKEKHNVQRTMRATVIDLQEDIALLEPVASEYEASLSNRISICITNLEKMSVQRGSVVEVTYKGEISKGSASTVNAISWRLSGNLSHLEYTGEYLDKSKAQTYEENVFGDVIITEIYSNCFFATPVVPMPYTIKFNGKLPDGFCVGDQVEVTHSTAYYNGFDKIEADMISVREGEFVLDPNMCYKPVIYLYPEAPTELEVKLRLNGELTCTYPAYDDGWNVLARPDSTLVDKNGQTYNYLYWEGRTRAQYDMSQGFCIRGEDTAEFLEKALEALGLNRREANEFIVYWLPLMQDNPYNIISFQGKEYTDNAVLEISQEPDTLIRVFMAWTPSDKYVEVLPQELSAPLRGGFTVVEWGGAMIQ